MTALAAHILCDKHNSTLSPLDTHAAAFMGEAMSAFAGLGANLTAPFRASRFNGDLIERWVLKACCGAIASGSLMEAGESVRREPPVDWLEVLFKSAPMPPGAGLYVRQSPIQTFRGYGIGAIYREGAWSGGGINVCGIELFIGMLPAIAGQVLESSTGTFTDLAYRPGAIRVEEPGHVVELHLAYSGYTPTEAIKYVRRVDTVSPPLTRPAPC
ncbi:MAG: hypothetical protein ABI831_15055 [Betaproteobacteria bacterium]